MSHPEQDEATSDMDMGAPQKLLFKVLSAVGDGCAARLGKLALPGRRAIDTPNFTAVTSRGVIPHLTPDIVSKYTFLTSAYMALEDFIEKKDPPILKTPPPKNHSSSRTLHNFTAFPSDIPTIVAARRLPPVVAPTGSTAKGIPIFTSRGFDTLGVARYASAVEILRPDIVIPLADLLQADNIPVSKRQLRMAERTEDWVDEFLGLMDAETRTRSPSMSVFAPVLAVEYPIQWAYLKHLEEDLMDQLAGLAVYDINILPELTNYKSFGPLPKMSLDLPKSPHDILRQISLGVDLIMAPFVNNASDAGVALTFTLPAPPETETLSSTATTPAADGAQPLGIDLGSAEHKTSLAPLQDGCTCHACQQHHRAYIHHLLNAKEMLGWNLLQVHNHHVLAGFFESIRAALTRGGSEEVETARLRFAAAYEEEMPAGTGERPRARGYHFKSGAAQEKYNSAGWKDLEGGEEQQQQQQQQQQAEGQ
ncbi:Queuine tRNA-ribosyltransferase-like protein [Hapsidospora chrysogenum ATCC 11550]|uniref:Queuine tRNA-ribosyltransferase accessory subunit 2 n=1 Tax=Hapsidospora chrysogenum (strain ATCC 11550 / CBS 779.69 / DSM 880 / IAM 14645 / JCM 23072 / IMI 49137) TaxID=857340 RepID=A0A086SW05_HAPC1|nr:Queuine tRNA-ribosyltransferase-like protein [Hapsidospora chrysogenum ATCC 11550]